MLSMLTSRTHVAAEMRSRSLDCSAVARLERVGAVGYAAALLRVQEVEGQDVHASVGEPVGEAHHETALLGRASAVRKDQRGLRAGAAGRVVGERTARALANA